MKKHVRLYYTRNNPQVRNTRKFFEENSIVYTEQCLLEERLSFDQFLEMLKNSLDGATEIISHRSHIAKKLIEEGIDIENMKLSQLFEIVQQQPKLLASLIIVCEGLTIVGYNEDELRTLLPRNQKEQLFHESLVLAKGLDVQSYDHAAEMAG
ncbi:ArsC/Spx/MgsR family protein [Pseudobacillus badius]|uniref:ArsC/Spx/MgsR family protein n=1 Tax=Bacillus badius TaxID=1455 RepID=UPI003CEB38F6